MPRSPRVWGGAAQLALATLLALAGCGRFETSEAALARAKKAVRLKQIAGLEQALAEAREKGVSRDRILIGVDEDVFRAVVSATLPQQVVIKERLRLRLLKAEPYFRYTQGVVMFDGRLEGVNRPDMFVAVRLAGGVDRVDFSEGRLATRIKIYYFEVRGSGLGEMSTAALEALVRANMDAVTDVIPPIEIPVRMEQGVTLDRFDEGPVSAKGGTLPFSASVARVLSVNGRLWIALQVDAGPWKSLASPEAPVAAPSPKAPGGKP